MSHYHEDFSIVYTFQYTVVGLLECHKWYLTNLDANW
jgi:hypothetical protein